MDARASEYSWKQHVHENLEYRRIYHHWIGKSRHPASNCKEEKEVESVQHLRCSCEALRQATSGNVRVNLLSTFDRFSQDEISQ